MTISYVQSSFVGGEWSGSAQGRFDDPAYRTAMAVARNLIPLEQHAATRRPGTRHVARTRSGQPGRLVKFDFKAQQPYNMEFTDGHLRFQLGPSLVHSNDAQAVTSISTGKPAQITTATAHGWASGDQVDFTLANIQCPLLQQRQFAITVVGPTGFTIADNITGDAIDGTTIGYTLGMIIAVQRVLDIVTPYTGGTWSTLQRVQTEKQAILLCENIHPNILTVDSDPAPGVAATFDLTPSDFQDGPYFDPVPHNGKCSVSALKGVVTLDVFAGTWSATSGYVKGDFSETGGTVYQSLIDANFNLSPPSSPAAWAVVNAGSVVGGAGFSVTDIGRHIRIYSAPDDYDAALTYNLGDSALFNLVAYRALVDSLSGVQPGTDNTKWAINPDGLRWTWGKIVAFQDFIPGNYGAPIGNLTSGGGLASAYDAFNLKNHTITAQGNFNDAYIGKDFSSAGAKAISVATIYPSIDYAFLRKTDVPDYLSRYTPIMINLRASHTAPASASSGTLLGSTGSISNEVVPISISSNDTATLWEYVWFEIIAVGAPSSITCYISQAVFNSPSAAATGTRVTFQILGPDALYITPVSVWRLGLYSDTTGWPTTGAFHENRLWLSGLIPNRIDSSRTGIIGTSTSNPFIFSPTEPDGTVADSCGVTYVFAAQDSNDVLWMASDERGLICGTQPGEWLVSASALNQPLTPTNVQAHRHTHNGCADTPPVRAGLALAFVKRYSRKLLEFFPDVYSGRFAAPNLSEYADHLTDLGDQTDAKAIAEITYQSEKTPIVWGRTNDGALIGITYKRESLFSSQPPNLRGWHRHDLGSGRTVESIVAGPSVGGNLDALSMVTSDGVTRHLEVMTDLPNENTTAPNYWLVDDGIVPSSSMSTAVNGANGVQLYGLWTHNGKTCTVVAGGLDCGDFAVANGTVFIPFGDGVSQGAGAGLFTQDWVDKFAIGGSSIPYIVGFTYTTQGQILRPNAPAETGSQAGPGFAKTRRTHYFGIMLQSTGPGLKFGTHFSKLRTAYFKTRRGDTYTADRLFSGIIRANPDDGYSYDSMPAWQVTRPQPCTVLALGGFDATQDV